MALLVYRIAVRAYSSADSTKPEQSTAPVMDRTLSKISSARLLDSNCTKLEDKVHSLSSSVNASVHLPFLSNDYASVYGQVTNSSSRTPADLLKRATTALFLMRCFQHVSLERFDDVEMTKILLRHLQSCSCNAYQVTEQLVIDGDVRNTTENEIGGGVYPTVSLCNHSCHPNVARHSNGRTCIVRAVRTIRKGDEILDNYGPHFLSNNLEERQKYLETQYFFKCTCEACSEKWPTVDKLQDALTQYKCIHCSVNTGQNLLKMNACLNCKKKCNYSKIERKFQNMSRDFNRALEDLLQGRLQECLRTCIGYCDLMDRVVVHPNKLFVKFQQVITLCWSLLGNTRTQK
jgi:Proteins containing SET domain